MNVRGAMIKVLLLTIEQGMKFKDLVSLGESLEESLLRSPLLDSLKILALFKELVKLTIR